MSWDCLSVGILVADHLCAPISHAPRAGELVMTDQLELNLGGCAANVGLDLARLGVQVAVAGCVGDDPFGQFIVDTLARGGVETGAIQRLADVGTSGTLIINVAGEDRRFVHTIGANGRFTASAIPLDPLRQARVLYVGGYFIMPNLAADGLAELFRLARSWGVKTVLDVVLPGPGLDYATPLARLLPHTDVFLPNHDEAALMTGLADPRAQALHFQSLGAGAVVITRGSDGTTLVSGELRLEAPAHRVDFVGGTGAGDAFDAGYIVGLLEGADPRRCLEWGAALGASCVRSISATGSVFTRDEALEFMRDRPLPISTW